MLNPGLNALALIRFGFGRGGGFFELIVLLAVVGTIAWALARSSSTNAAKTGGDAAKN